ncbi:hypothetical protein [Rhodoblastus sp.]|jgi:hypothetical protein|uniref:hypothetical protein n=1 Tax=Rhodoblastus sp. TaxID=1962975 RepID=UPI0025E8577B|nr:hypothetical protein [Rhodoblastus sp.]
MRDLLTYIGIALIVVLSAAFAAPFVVDFDAMRPRLAEELSQAAGARVRFDGPIALRFLPTPRFSSDNLEVLGEFGSLRAKKAVFALALPALLQGRLQFSRALFEDAEIALDSDKARRPKAAALQFDNLILRRAHVTVSRVGTTAVELSGLNVTAQIPSLQGPFSARGSFDRGGQRLAFSLASDVVAKNLLPLKASLTWPGESAKLDLDGRVDLAVTPAFEGEAKAAGKAAPGPWTAQGSVLLWLDGALAKEVSARLGDGPLADKVSGSARYETRSGTLGLNLDAPSLSGPWAEFFAAPALAAKDRGAPLDLRASVEALDWRGMAWSQAQIFWRAGAPAQVRAVGPGGAKLEISAALDKSGWRGRAQLKASDFTAFAAALREAAPVASQALAGANLHALDIGGEFAASPGEWALTNASLALDRARLSGEIRFRPEQADARPLLWARLSAPALDLDLGPDFAGTRFDGLDLDLSLEAQTVKSARAGVLSGEGGRIRAHLLRAGEATRLERLEIRNIGGADLTASAAWGKDFSGLQGEARLKAGELGPLAQALARLWPGAAGKALAARAKNLSPADLAGKAGDGGFTLSGTLGATKLAASFVPAAGGKRDVALELTAPEASALLNQFGAQTVWTQRLGPARVSARTQADPSRDGGQNVTASADLAGLRAEFRGALADPAGDFSVAGDATLSGDAGKILSGFSAAPTASAPLRLAARAAWRDGGLTLQSLNGEWAGAKLSGDLSAEGEGLKGALRLDRLSAPALAALVLGPPAPVKAGALWPSLSFAPVIFDPPRARLAIETADLQPFGARARFDLTLGPGELSVAQAVVEGFGGVIGGGLNLRREGAQVTLSGEAKGENLNLKNSALSARLGFKLNFAGNGANAAALVGSLAGDGAARLLDLAIEGAALRAPDQALAASEANEAPFDAKEVARSLDAAFAREAQRRSEANFTFRLAGGQAAFTPADAGAQGLEAGFDLRDASFSLALSSAAQELPEGWDAPAPRGAVVWSGPWRMPSRRVDATSFVNAVAMRALDREHARIEMQKRQDLERLRAISAQPAVPDAPAQPAPAATEP